MFVRPIVKRDEETLSLWWNKYRMLVTKDALPDTGFIVDNIAATWLYKTNSRVASIVWTISNKEALKEEREEAIKLLIREAEKEALKEGYNIMLIYAENISLQNKFIKEGYQIQDTEVFNLTKFL